MNHTLIFVVITVISSIAAFNSRDIYNKFIMYPYIMKGDPKQYYRLLSCGLIHADWVHLFFNMFTLYSFGSFVESIFNQLGSPLLYPMLYILGIIASSLPDLVKHANHSYFRSLGASGGVSAVLFASIYFYPWTGIRLFLIPFDIPAIVFGVLYLLYCVYMSKRGGDNINHDAHFWGAVFGLVYSFAFDPTHGKVFINQIMHPGG